MMVRRIAHLMTTAVTILVMLLLLLACQPSQLKDVEGQSFLESFEPLIGAANFTDASAISLEPLNRGAASNLALANLCNEIPDLNMDELRLDPFEAPFPWAVPCQRIIAGPEEIVCANEFIIGLCFADQRTVNDLGVMVVEQFRIQYPYFKNNEVPTDARPQIMMLIQGANSLELENLFADQEEVTNAPNSYLFVLEACCQSGGHSPFGESPVFIYTNTVTLQDFEKQWGIKAIKDTAFYDTYDETEGDGVIVGIFDSSPYAGPDYLTAETIEMDDQVVLPLTAHYRPLANAGITHFGVDHGIMVAGLIHAIAPEADLHLYRSFNDSGLTDVFKLADRLHEFYLAQVRLPLMNGEPPVRAVANLSFGLVAPPVLTSAQQHQYDKSIQNVSDNIDALVNNGVVVLAAAGNTLDAYSQPAADFPASHPKVISVGALNNAQIPAPSCFTHEADIYLPGGEAHKEMGVNGPTCVAYHNLCTLNTVCDDALMSFATQSPTQLAYWLGTSFSTPLGVGLTALMLGNNTLYSVPTTTVPLNGPKAVVQVNDVNNKLTTGLHALIWTAQP